MSIEIHGLNFTHPTRENPSLSDISFEAPRGTITVIIGKTGAGKSTLLEVISGQRKPSSGNVSVDDEPLWTDGKVNRNTLMKMGYVFQYPEHQLFSTTVAREFYYSLKPFHLNLQEEDRRMDHALSQIGLSKELKRRSPFTLSTGQKRRTALATTLATMPRWLLLDEPTAGLDSQSVQQLVETLTRIHRHEGGSIIIATHDLETFLPLASRVIVLDGGKLVADLTPDELYQHPEILSRASIGLPSGLRVTRALRHRGINVTSTWNPILTGRELATIIRPQLETRINRETAINRENPTETEMMSHEERPTEKGTSREAAVSVNPYTDGGKQSAIAALDPRIKWFVYTLLSIGCMLQSSWIGLLVSVAALFTLAGLIRLPAVRVMRLFKPLFMLSVISLLVSGVKFGHTDAWHIGSVGFHPASTLPTLQSLGRLYCLMVASAIFTFCTSPLQMKQGLAIVLRRLAVLKISTEAVSLGAALILRFIPLITKELDRFARIARVRGKRTTRHSKILLRDLHVILVPFVISILQLGDELATAMEARGYDSLHKERTVSARLRMNRLDWITLLVGTMIFVLLLFTSQWFHS